MCVRALFLRGEHSLTVQEACQKSRVTTYFEVPLPSWRTMAGRGRKPFGGLDQRGYILLAEKKTAYSIWKEDEALREDSGPADDGGIPRPWEELPPDRRP